MMQTIDQVQEVYSIVEQIKMRFANPETVKVQDTPSFILMKFQDFAKRNVSLQLEKHDIMHFIYINGVRDMVSTDEVLSVLC